MKLVGLVAGFFGLVLIIIALGVSFFKDFSTVLALNWVWIVAGGFAGLVMGYLFFDSSSTVIKQRDKSSVAQGGRQTS